MKAVGYVRPPTARREGRDVSKQEDRIRTWCRDHGHELVAVEVDAETGEEPDREAFSAALDLACREGAVLVGESLTRLFPSPEEASRSLEALSRSGAHVGGVREDLDTSTADGTQAFRMARALEEVEEASRRRAEEAAPLPHRIPFGFEPGPDGRSLRPHPGEQQVIRRVRSLRVRGWSLGRIAEELDRLGHEPREGGAWSSRAVSSLLNRRVVRRAQD